MENVSVCPRCGRVADRSDQYCPGCAYPLSAATAGPESPRSSSGAPGEVTTGPDRDTNGDGVLLVTRPEAMSFIGKYLLALIPVLLVMVCIVVRGLLDGIYHVVSSTVASSIPSSAATSTTGLPDIMNQYTETVNLYSAGVNSSALLMILFIAPVGIFLLVMVIGWTLRIPEMWGGPLMALGLAGMVALLLAGTTATSGRFVFSLLEWIAFLIQPFSIAAAVIVIALTEKFRKSIVYSITRNGISIRGGIWNRQEHIIPHHQVGRIVLEQDFLGARCNYGTIIPQTVTRWGAESSIRGIGAGGQKDSGGMGIGFGKVREEASRYPLDCLYGIPNPKAAQQVLEKFMFRKTALEEEQLAYLRKIYEDRVVPGQPRTMDAPAPLPPSPRSTAATDTAAFTPEDIPADTRTVPLTKGPDTGTAPDPVPAPRPIVVSRMQDDDLPDSCACSICGKKELPPFIEKDGNCYCRDHRNESRRNNGGQ